MMKRYPVDTSELQRLTAKRKIVTTFRLVIPVCPVASIKHVGGLIFVLAEN